MKNDFKSVQKKIDKLFWETSEKNTGKTYEEMIRDPEYKQVIKKISKLVVELEEIQEEKRNNEKKKRNA
jgi:hypothetical protein